MSSITSFIKHNYRHFNAAALVDAANAYNKLLADGGKMFVTIGGAMSTAELGLSLAEMIRLDKVHGICCTGANLEEDVFNLVAHDFYERVPHYRDLTPADEEKLLSRHMNRVTDTCIPEMEAMRRIENEVLKEWVRADQAGERYFPHQFMYKILLSGDLKQVAVAALTGDLTAVAEMREAFDRRRRTIVRMLNEIPGVECPEPTGAFYAYPSVKGVLGKQIAGRTPTTSAELAELILDEAEVAVVPGEAFGAPGYLRLSYALGDDDLAEGVGRMQKLLG